jgi:hypothetical protein
VSDGALPDSLTDFADGDVRAATLMRTNLVALREQLVGRPGSEDLSRDVSAVLEGRMTMRDLAEVPAFRDLAVDGMRQAEKAWQRLSPADRGVEMEAGTALIDDATA